MLRVPKLSFWSGSICVAVLCLLFYMTYRLETQEYIIKNIKASSLLNWEALKKFSKYSQTPEEVILNNLRTKHLDPPLSGPYNLTGGNVMHDGTIGKFINDYLMKLPPGGFFFEAGALDGERGSNTLWLEQRRNWTGILVEANPFSYKHLRYRKRKSWSSNACVSVKEAATSITFEIPFIEGEKTINWMVESNSRLVDSDFHSYDDKIKKMSKFYNVTVDCYPLSYFFKVLDVKTVDFLSLDVQGGEKTILLNFPFDEIKIKYILVEYLHFEKRGGVPKRYDQDFVDKMNQKGFKLIQHNSMTYDYYFVSKKL